MAEEAQYGSDSAVNKRKYEDEATPPPPPSAVPRRASGFSAPIVSQSPDGANAPALYNNVPPPELDPILMAKQKAQEIAARLYNSAEAKRPKVENGGYGGYDSSDNAAQKPLVSPVAPPSSAYSAYGNSNSYQGQTTKKIDIPNGRVGVIIGKGGETIKYLQMQSGSKIQVTRDTDADPYSQTRAVELMGTPAEIEKAEKLIQDVLSEAESGGSGIVSRRVSGQPSGGEQYVTKIPNNKVGLVIGKGGETIKNMQANSGARIQVIPLHLPPGDPSTERTLQIDGTAEQIEIAKNLVNEVISENRPRNSSMGGGYSQQGYQARPPTSWAPPPMQQPYGYAQPGAYTAPAPYAQQQYPGYPPQPAAGGYATGWDQTTGAPTQQAAQGGGYDYYGQQQQAPGASAAPADSTNYGYAQPPAASYPQGQGYPQDNSYGGYQAPAAQYGQPQTNPGQGYDQQSYAAAGYGSAPAPTAEGQTPAYGATQGDTTQAPPSSQSAATVAQPGYAATPSPNPAAGYPPQGSTQPGYGAPAQASYGTQPPTGYGPNYGQPQAPKPPASQSPYGQPQQSPSAQGGYAQPGYAQAPPAQGSYAQPDTGAPRAPASGYGATAAQPGGYGAPQYGAPPAAQPGYGQQPPPYNSSYGGAAYSQPPAYAADGNTGAVPTSQAGGVAKASPPS